MSGVLIKRGKSGLRDTDTQGRHHVPTEAEIRMTNCGPKNTRDCQVPPNTEEAPKDAPREQGLPSPDFRFLDSRTTGE